MRTSHGIILSSFLLLLLTIIFISISPTSGVHVNPTKMTTNHAFSINHHRHFHCHRRSFSSPPSRNKLQPHYWCMQDPPSSPELDIDPRYGVEKRLVPSGPNPLHN
ncbi:Aquaporin-like protein [Dioscorea alata]|uniref:Aquaporin-like protein n=1 Tax=Dioscorea alata TaxID=55571 RepID=A0ACB7UK01_DIOAL|nr:Aquaporin-like protein [Dioscorea alata]